jgi:hypothetical protein
MRLSFRSRPASLGGDFGWRWSHGERTTAPTWAASPRPARARGHEMLLTLSPALRPSEPSRRFGAPPQTRARRSKSAEKRAVAIADPVGAKRSHAPPCLANAHGLAAPDLAGPARGRTRVIGGRPDAVDVTGFTPVGRRFDQRRGRPANLHACASPAEICFCHPGGWRDRRWLRRATGYG